MDVPLHDARRRGSWGRSLNRARTYRAVRLGSQLEHGRSSQLFSLRLEAGLVYRKSMVARRDDAIKAFEQDAETLVVYQTDIIAQIESQLRAARQMIRLVQTLRGVPHRVGPEPTDTQ